jgi:ATP-dependent helicase/nuclease subunit B
MILGPLEARLQHADLMILADMNEGSWPAPPPVDPWLPPAARRALGLPVAETRIGLEAHDLLSAAADEILITRARRDESGPTVRSRFLLRLDAAFGELPEDRELEAALALDGPGRTETFQRPEPAPPAAERPRTIRVTEADMLAADPFSFYARRMLGLGELDPLEQEADAAVRGTAVHRILERLVKERPNDPDTLIVEELDRLGGDPALLRLWRPRVRRMVAWVMEQLRQDTAEGWAQHCAEVKLSADWHGVRIEGKADRIDVHADGVFRIIDYKTGGVPTKRDYEAGMFRQLPLLRLLLESGADPKFAGDVAMLEYWKLSGGNREGERKGASWPVPRDAFEEELAQLFGRYLHGNAPFTPKVAPVFAQHYRSFDQLARVEEWL